METIIAEAVANNDIREYHTTGSYFRLNDCGGRVNARFYNQGKIIADIPMEEGVSFSGEIFTSVTVKNISGDSLDWEILSGNGVVNNNNIAGVVALDENSIQALADAMWGGV